MNELFYIIAFVAGFSAGFSGFLVFAFAIQLTYVRITKGRAAAKQFFKEEW